MPHSSEEQTWTLDDYEAMRAALNISPLCLRVSAEIIHWEALHISSKSDMNTGHRLSDDHIWHDEDYEYLKETTGSELIEAMILSAATTPPARYAYTVPESPNPGPVEQLASKLTTRRPQAQRRSATLTPSRSTKVKTSDAEIATQSHSLSLPLPVKKKPLLSDDDTLSAYIRLSCIERGEEPSVFSQVIVGRSNQVPRFESMRELYENGKVSMSKLDQIYAGQTEWEVPRLDIRPLFRGPFTHGANLYMSRSQGKKDT